MPSGSLVHCWPHGGPCAHPHPQSTVGVGPPGTADPPAGRVKPSGLTLLLGPPHPDHPGQTHSSASDKEAVGASETPGEEGKGGAGSSSLGQPRSSHTPEDRPLTPLLRKCLAQGPALGQGWSVHPGLCTQVTPQGPARGASSRPP